MEIFNYQDEHAHISIHIDRSIIRNAKDEKDRITGINIMSNLVLFHYIGLDLDNSFEALSAVNSLLTIFKNRQFDQNSKRVACSITHDEQEIRMHAKKDSSQAGRLPRLELSIENEKHRISMSQVYIIQFAAALHKAMNWLAPYPDIV